jgi:hypothetical protein
VIRSISLPLILLASINLGHAQQSTAPQQTDPTQPLKVRLVALEDRWADYSSMTDAPSFRDFLAVGASQDSSGKPHEEFIKLRIEYWSRDNADPKRLADSPSLPMLFVATREAACDETFASLSRIDQVSYVDPEMKPSRFVSVPGALTKRPSPKSVLPCYAVK